MLLAPVAEIREHLGFDDMVDINEAIKGALHAAEPYLAAALGTPFERVNCVDIFYVNEPYTQGALVRTELRLRRGLVALDGFSVTSSESPVGLDTAGTVRTSDFELQSDLGVAVDIRNNYQRTYLRVAYTAGFEVDKQNPDSYDLTQVPSWLRELAKLQALIALETHPALEEAGIKQDTKMLDSKLTTILRGRMRYTPSALLPL